jgi:PKD repeat protein
LSYPAQNNYGATYKGFNDTLAAWSQNRIMNQNCGQTWLNTWNEVGKYYSSTRQLESMQIVTWNDYEEGTEIETGIENCVTVSASASADTLSWTMTGSQSTIDQFMVFISEDGENLMPLVEVSAGLRSVDLTQFEIAPGDYTLYVKAIGKPSMTNKMSGAVSFSVADPGPIVQLSVTPSSGIAPVTVTASTAGSTSPAGSITSSVIDFGDGYTVRATTASHTYSTPGTYTVMATVTDRMNVSTTQSTAVTIAANRVPQAFLSVTPSSGTAPVMVTASTAASTVVDGSIASSTINFGDGSVVNGTTSSHTYATAGQYTVTATVKDDRGATAIATATVSVNAAVVPGIVTVTSPTAGSTTGSPVRFVASATANTGNRITAMRVYVDGSSAYSVAANTLDTSLNIGGGTHSIVVQAWDNTGIVYKTPFSINVVVNKAPVVALSVNPTVTTTGTPVNVSMAGTTDPDGTVATYTVDFGDGTVAYAGTASHAYARAGTYIIKAAATDNAGAASTLTQTVTITDPVTTYGVLVKSPTQGAKVGSPVRFIASATSKNPITAMRIYVDGASAYTTSAAKIDTYVKMSLGTHNVIVQAWDSAGAVYKSSLTLTVP